MMKLESQVVSLEIAKKLKELGVKQESLFYWFEYLDSEKGVVWGIDRYNAKNGELPISSISAFTVAELGELLPDYTETFRSKEGIRFVYERCHKEEADTEANARGKMLVYLLENKLL